jgi:hypothetical protein
LLFNVNPAILQHYHDENKLTLNVIGTYVWICIVLAHWNNTQRIDAPLGRIILSWFHANLSLFFLLNSEHLAEKQQIRIFLQSLGLKLGKIGNKLWEWRPFLRCLPTHIKISKRYNFNENWYLEELRPEECNLKMATIAAIMVTILEAIFNMVAKTHKQFWSARLLQLQRKLIFRGF